MGVTIVIVLTMFYAFYKWHIGDYDKYTNIDRFFGILAVAVAIFMIARFIISGNYNIAPIFETIIVIAEISATVLLAYRKIAGWYACIVMSTLASILVAFINPNPAIVLGILEASSIYFYYKGIKSFSSKHLR